MVRVAEESELRSAEAELRSAEAELGKPSPPPPPPTSTPPPPPPTALGGGDVAARGMGCGEWDGGGCRPAAMKTPGDESGIGPAEAASAQL